MSSAVSIAPPRPGELASSEQAELPNVSPTDAPRSAPERPRRLFDGASSPPPTLRALTPPRRPSPSERGDLRVLSLNIQLNGEGGRLPGIIGIIRDSGADLIGLQECSADTANRIARELGYNVVQTGGGTPVLSPHHIEPPPSGRRGVIVRHPSGEVLFMNLHLAHAPYQPFQLLRIPYADAPFLNTEAEAIAAALATRGSDVDDAVTELSNRGARLPTIAVGDFNQPSHLDWTEAAARIRRHPLRVRWPESTAFARAGFNDAYRTLFPDAIAKPGFTWTPKTAADDPNDHHDRIDFVYYRGSLTPTRARIIGESAATSDIVVHPYPTDHRGLLIDFTLPLSAGATAAIGG